MDDLTILLLALLTVSVWGLIGTVIWLALRYHGRDDSHQIAALRAEMQALRIQVGQNLGTVTQQVRAFGSVQRGIGQVTEATQRILALGENIAALQNILSAPQLRGGLGEIMLGNLLAQVLPSERYCLQYTFADGARVDAVISLADHVVPIDAKFPLENFQRMMHATDDKARASAQRAFVRDVRRRVDETAKYVRPDAGTFEFAMMYIPAENVYYEVLSAEDLCKYALERRVVPVSPNSFYAYLNVIVFGLRGLEIEENARLLLGQLSRLESDFDTCREAYGTLGGHIARAHSRYGDVDSQLERFGRRLSEVAGGAALPASSERRTLPRN
jgi:DNA recombination protein RmuC